jgi:hypothetical protein
MAIYFGQQVPTAAGKYFSATVYSKLGGIAGGTQDVKLYEQELLLPMFTDTVNHFTIYRFDTPLQLPAGVFYLGTTQPASSGSDSLYIGWDANRVAGNHLYFSTLNSWLPSIKSGALMIRPLLGGPISGTAVDNVAASKSAFSVYPNPCSAELHIAGNKVDVAARYLISDMQGRTIQEGVYNSSIPVSTLPAGIYLLRIRQDNYWTAPKKFIRE